MKWVKLFVLFWIAGNIINVIEAHNRKKALKQLWEDILDISKFVARIAPGILVTTLAVFIIIKLIKYFWYL